MRLRTSILTLIGLALMTPPVLAAAGQGNRLTYLDDPSNPYYVGLNFPKLITPQWVGEDGVEAVVVLAIDDMTDNTAKYEAFLRPILDRLKAIDGRAPLSIMTNRVKPDDPQLQTWLREGVHIDAHTLTHPCPLLQKGDFAAAERTYHDCVDLLNKIPGNKPVAFRMPCCDSQNTVSPRFYAEIFNKPSHEGHYLTIDSSVFNIITPDDPSLPRNLVLDQDGRERFRKYLPFKSFVNTIENYPYPYVIGRLCWEFPCIVPSDWEGQNLNKPNSPKTVEDMKAALDAVVLKQGVFCLVFHPHGWIKSEQVVELIDHAVKTHGKKVKFLNFAEAQERINMNLLDGQPLLSEDDPLRKKGKGFLLDVDNDGFMDVILSNETRHETRRWDPRRKAWETLPFPIAIVAQPKRRALAPRFGREPDEGITTRVLQFGVVRQDGQASVIVRDEEVSGGWHFDGRAWVEDPALLNGLQVDGKAFATSVDPGVDRGVRLCDIDGDGCCELIVATGMGGPKHPPLNAVFRWSDGQGWTRLPFVLPDGAHWVDEDNTMGGDSGLRLVDLDEDGRLDVVFSSTEAYAINLFESMEAGWSRKVMAGRRTAEAPLPPIVQNDRRVSHPANNGFWVHSRSLWWQNEDTAKLPDLVDRRSFNDLLKDVEPRAKSAEASLRSIRVRPGFKVELVAQEPLVEDPIAFEWGPEGKLWVVEMGDYPLGVDGKGKPGGVIKFLEDSDHDGKYDKATTFLDGLPFPTGLMPWRKGILVAAAPDIFYAEDRDGDGKADHRETLFTGFHEGNQQHRLNGFELGLDGWVYGANGDSGGTVTSLKTGKKVSIQGCDFRFQPDTGEFETESGMTQYGRHRDDWGNWFGNDNSVVAWHYVLAEHELRRNPRLAVSDAREILDHDTKVYPISRTLARFNDPDNRNRITSANSPTPYRDELFGPVFANSLFVSEPVHNLVRRVVLDKAGVTFRGHRAADEADREFLASSDNWFRPTMLKTGPDGALWVADMYRAVIEHPEWIPDDWEAKLDLRAGHDQGRIYRVYPVDQKPRPIPRLDQLDTSGLVAALDSPSGWQRDTAQRLLLHAGDRSAVEPLRKLALLKARPKTRVQALYTLAGLAGLDVETVRQALSDEHPEVRRAALRAGERVLDDPSLRGSLDRLADDPDVRVRFALALALGAVRSEVAGRLLAKLLRREGADHWFRVGALTSARPHVGALMANLFAEVQKEPPSEVIEPVLNLALAEKQTEGLGPLLRALATPREGRRFAAWQFSALASLLDAADRSGTSLAKLIEDQPEDKPSLDHLNTVFDAARVVVGDESAPEADRIAAARVLGRPSADPGADLDRLAQLLQPRVPSALQMAAVAALARLQSDRVPAILLEGWKSHTPQLRGAILDTLLSRPAWVGHLIAAIEAGRVPAAEIDVARRRRLLNHPNAEIRPRAAQVFEPTSGGRAAVVAAFRPALALSGDPKAGAAVFKKICANCHRLNGEGHEVGPDLAALTDKSPEALLIAILDPNRAFEAKFTNFNVQTTDGRVLTGLIAAETGTSVTLRREEGREDVLLRSEIEAMAGSGQSLMPEGLEKDLTKQSLADLIAYLASTGPTGKVVAGNHPERVQPGADGTITLRAETAEIHGDVLTFEPKHGNLGFWSEETEHAAWKFAVDRAGRYAVWLDYACDNGSQGNALILEFDQTQLKHKVAGTGSWDDYRKTPIGELDLSAGSHRLDLRPSGRIRGALIDLRAVELRPVGSGAAAKATCCDP
jgi:putative membrane-bound dehydrogenase-like protein